MNIIFVQALIRHALTAVGGGLVTSGSIDGQTMEAITGGVIALVGVAWSAWEKYKRGGSNAAR